MDTMISCGGKTALHLAAENGWHQNVRLLSKHTRDTPMKDENGRSPLHLAAANGHVDVLRELLLASQQCDKGLAINARDGRGMTALHIAAKNGNESVV